MKNLNFIVMLFSAMLFSLCGFSCSSQQKVSGEHNAQNSLDYDGIYRGIIPCADCPGIKTTVYISRDGIFKSTYEYIDRNSSYEKTGKYSWNKEGNTITLQPSSGASTKYFVGENQLIQLDKDGNKITGELANHFILTKENYALLNKKWKLQELMGEKIDLSQALKKDAFIEFNDKDNRYSASAGCNTLSGAFEIKPLNKLVLKQGISTMMSCPDMTLEQKLAKVLQMADSFQIQDGTLILTKGRMAPLAKFVFAQDAEK